LFAHDSTPQGGDWTPDAASSLAAEHALALRCPSVEDVDRILACTAPSEDAWAAWQAHVAALASTAAAESSADPFAALEAATGGVGSGSAIAEGDEEREDAEEGNAESKVQEDDEEDEEEEEDEEAGGAMEEDGKMREEEKEVVEQAGVEAEVDAALVLQAGPLAFAALTDKVPNASGSDAAASGTPSVLSSSSPLSSAPSSSSSVVPATGAPLSAVLPLALDAAGRAFAFTAVRLGGAYRRFAAVVGFSGNIAVIIFFRYYLQ
jgi:hypothetical protein